MQLTELSDDELVSHLAAICLEGHRLTARLVVHLIEVEERRLDLRLACTSLFDFCVRRLGMSEGAAFRRINAARLVKRFPLLLGSIERGEIHLSSLVSLRPHLNEANVDELVRAVAGKTQREVEAFVARIAPKPDVPSQILELPPVVDADAGPMALAPAAPLPAPRPRIEPLSETRFKVQLTASAELRDKLERARNLMRHRNPSGDLAVVVEQALDALLAKLEKERLGKTVRPQRTLRRSAPGRVRRAARREVFERDGEQCAFVGEDGTRCPSRTLLELDHVESRALGGPDDPKNLRVLCRAHNRLHAEEVFGRERIADAVDLRQRKSRRVMRVTPECDAPPETEEVAVATRGLVNMGFRKPDVRRALDEIGARRAATGSALRVEELVREALSLLA